CAQARDEDAAAAEGDLAPRTPAAIGAALGIGGVLRATELSPVLLHHRSQHLLAGIEAESKERSARVLEHGEQRQRHLHRGHGWGRMPFPGERSCATSLHGGSLPFGLSNHRPYRTAEGDPALSPRRALHPRRANT